MLVCTAEYNKMVNAELVMDIRFVQNILGVGISKQQKQLSLTIIRLHFIKQLKAEYL